MATAAVRLGDHAICAELLAELEPVTDTCGVNGALVCFMGSNAHWAGILAGALGRREDAHRWLRPGADRAPTARRAGVGSRDQPGARRAGRRRPARRAGRAAGRRARPARRRRPAGARRRRPASLDRRRRDRTPSCVATASCGGSATSVPPPTCAISRGCPTSPCCWPGPAPTCTSWSWPAPATPTGHSGTLLDATARAAYRRRLAELDDDLADAHARPRHRPRPPPRRPTCRPDRGAGPRRRARRTSPDPSAPAPPNGPARPSPPGYATRSTASKPCSPNSARTSTARC